MKNGPMNRAQWARRKADDLLVQAAELDKDRTGDWRARARRSRGSEALREQARRLEQLANRLDPPEWDMELAF